MPQADTPAKSASTGWNRIAYGVFTLAGILFTCWGSDRTQGPMFLALALVFDPYDAAVAWKDRPRWTRLLLLAHLGLAAAALGYVMARCGRPSGNDGTRRATLPGGHGRAPPAGATPGEPLRGRCR